MAFPDVETLKYSPELRELNFGVQEGLHFDNLPDAEKEKFADPTFKADGGESWPEVNARAVDYFRGL